MVIWSGSHKGKLPRINRKYAAIAIKGKGRVYVTPEYRKGVNDLAASFAGRSTPIADLVNAYIEIGMWSQADSDSPIKGVFDALQQAGVIENDKLIRDFVVLRQLHARSEEDWVRVVIVEQSCILCRYPEGYDDLEDWA